MAIPFRQCLWLICGAVVLVSREAQAQSDAHTEDPLTLKSVVSAWTAREARARTIDISAVGTEFRAGMTFTAGAFQAFGRPDEKAPVTVPDTSFVLKVRLAIDGGELFRMEYSGKDHAPKGGSLSDHHFVDFFNADEGRRCTIFLENHYGYPSGHIRKADAPVTPTSPQLLPIRLIYRPFDPQIAVFDATKLRLTKGKGVVDDRTCLILGDSEKTVWVDPALDFMPVRYFETENGVRRRSIEIKYAADSQHGWVPVSWTSDNVNPQGEPVDSAKMTVAKFKVGEPIAREIFEPQYPPGSLVRNYEKGEHYILRKDRTRRMILKSEISKKYEELMQTDQPDSNRTD